MSNNCIFNKLMNVTHLYCCDPHPLTYHTVLRYIAISYTRSELIISHYINPSYYINGELISKANTINYMDYDEFDVTTVIKHPMVFLHFNTDNLPDDHIKCSAKSTTPYTTVITLESTDVNASIEVTMSPTEGLQYKIIDTIPIVHEDLC